MPAAHAQITWWSFSSTTTNIAALENPMFLGKDGDRTIFQIMTRHGVDIGAFSVRSPHLSLLMSGEDRSDEERAWRRWLRVLLVAGHPVGGGGASPRRNHPQGALATTPLGAWKP